MDDAIGPEPEADHFPRLPMDDPWQAPAAVPFTPASPSIGPVPPAPAPPPTPTEPPSPRRRMRSAALGVAAVAAMVGAGFTGALINERIAADDDGSSIPPRRASDQAIEIGAARDGDLPPIDVGAVAGVVGPSVVTISADLEGPAGAGGSIGTGVITSTDGEIVTNAHVVEDAIAIRVRLAGETEPREATLLASDPGNDLALLRVAGDGFQAATFADPGSIRIGDEVVAIGFALDLDGAPSVTLGIVSALDRTITVGGPGDGALDGLIQTDAAISSGNSGGPLVNSRGEVVGINSAVARGDALTAASNVGFAISVKEALPVMTSLREQAAGKIRKEAFLGVNISPRQDGGQGAIVVEVDAGTPADEAGIRPDDLVIAVDDVPIAGPAGLVAVIRDHEPGDEVEVVARRGDEQLTFTVVLAERVSGE